MEIERKESRVDRNVVQKKEKNIKNLMQLWIENEAKKKSEAHEKKVKKFLTSSHRNKKHNGIWNSTQKKNFEILMIFVIFQEFQNHLQDIKID